MNFNFLSMQHPNADIMAKAIKLAKNKHKEGGHAVAAIVVYEDEIISETFTTVRRDNDPTAHAVAGCCGKNRQYLSAPVTTLVAPSDICKNDALHALVLLSISYDGGKKHT